MTGGESRRERLSRLRNDLSPLYVATQKPHGPDARRLPGTPKLLPGESFSSWQWRVQTLLRIPTKAFQSALGIHAPANWVDAGRHQLDIERLAYTVMHPVETLEPLLWPSQSLLSDSRLTSLTWSPVRRRPVIRYCELCLRSDLVPHIRQLWRLACAYICPQHGTVLRELCPHCQQAFEMPAYKHRRADRPLKQCHSCGNDISAGTPATLPGELRYFILARQTELLTLISAGSRLADAWGGLQTSGEYSFSTGTSGLIDMESEQNSWVLFRRLLGSYVTQAKPTEEQARCALEAYLTKVPVEQQGDAMTLPVALNGLRLFGKHAADMFMYLIGRHDPWGATHWGSDELVHNILGSSVFDRDDFAPELQRIWPKPTLHRKRRRYKQQINGKTEERAPVA